MGCGASSGKKYEEPPPVALNDLDDAPKPPPPAGSTSPEQEKKSPGGEKLRDTDKYRAENVLQDLEVLEGEPPPRELAPDKVRLRSGNDQMPASADSRHVPDAQDLLHKYAQQEAMGATKPKPYKSNNSHIFAPSSAPFSSDVVRSGRERQAASKSPARSPMDDHEMLGNNQVGGLQMRPKMK